MPRTSKKKQQRQRAEQATGIALTMLTVFVISLWLADLKAPPRGQLFELLWAAPKRPLFYWLIGLALTGIATSIPGLRRAGRHRPWLITGWAVGLAIIVISNGPEMAAMLRVIWWQLQQ